MQGNASPCLVMPCNSQLACVNRKIAEQITRRSNANVHAIFANAAFLAGEAIAAATELAQIPGTSTKSFAETLEFWHRLRDYAGTAALDCLGGNNTLAEALVTFRFLNCRGEK
jgi:hypothetical protein